MPSLIGHMGAFTQILASATDVETGAPLSLKGSVRSLLLINWDEEVADPEFAVEDDFTDATPGGSAVGSLLLEISHDSGTTWETAEIARRLEDADEIAAPFSVITSDALPALLKINYVPGDVLLRARITAEFAEPITVLGVVIGP